MPLLPNSGEHLGYLSFQNPDLAKPMKIRLILSLTAGLGIVAGCSRSDSIPESAQAPVAIRVHIEKTHFVTLTATTDVSGVVRPFRSAKLASKLMGSILEMPISLGQNVRAGDLLVKISAGEIAARLVQAQAQLDQARFDLNRERELLAKNASTSDLVHNLETRVAVSDSMVQEAETFIGYSEIRAPFNGTVSSKLADVGDLASPGMPLLEIDEDSACQIEVEVPDSIASSLRIGAKADVDIPSAATSFSAELKELSSSANTSAHTVTAKFAVPSGVALHSGEFARLHLPGKPVQSLFVPDDAVLREGQMEKVFICGEDHHTALRLVKTGARSAGRVEILAGVDVGESVVISPPVGLREGQTLEVQP